MDITQKNKSWVLVTGASSGIGLAFAEELAADGKNLILVARNKTKLAEISERLTRQYTSKVHVVSADLGSQDGIQKLFKETEDFSVSFLINNAGREDSGHFLDLDVSAMVGTVSLNCVAPLMLSHHYGNLMKKNGSGEILFVASIVGFQGVPLIANYAATKSFDLILAEGLAAELKPHNIKVTVVAPGFTDTNLSTEISFTKVPMKPASPQSVARSSLNARHTKLLYIPGVINKVLFYLGKYIQSRKTNTMAFGKVFSKVLSDKLKAA
ncbi:MAG: SDR family NAD(P)-dependent oxidoreductase [Pseudomonas marincola]